MTDEERKKAIENLEFSAAVGIRPSKEAFKVALEALEQQPKFIAHSDGTIEQITTRERGEWILVSEGLPKLGQEVLCYCQAKIYDVLRYTKDGWFKDAEHCYMDSFVIAWMPLPELYKESEQK